jgi:hypothetical protein
MQSAPLAIARRSKRTQPAHDIFDQIFRFFTAKTSDMPFTEAGHSLYRNQVDELISAVRMIRNGVTDRQV